MISMKFSVQITYVHDVYIFNKLVRRDGQRTEINQRELVSQRGSFCFNSIRLTIPFEFQLLGWVQCFHRFEFGSIPIANVF